MKLFIYYDEIAACDTTIKIKLPKKWRDGPVANLKETFIEHFNKKHPAQRLVFAAPMKNSWPSSLLKRLMKS